jgi:hypothetical protein
MTDTLEAVFLETWLDDHAQCTAPHEDPRNLVCSELVTHVFKFCRGPNPVCANTAAYVSWVLTGEGTEFCSYCGKFCTDDWAVVEV